MPSEQALRYQAYKSNFPVELKTALYLLDKKINLHRLLEIASNATSSKCINAEAVAAGGFNQIYLLTFEDRPEAVARVVHNAAMDPNPHDLVTLRLRSEAATIEYIRTHTTVPVPKSLYFTTDPSGEGVGAPFSIQEKITGLTLDEVAWPGKLSNEAQDALVKSLATIEAQLTSVGISGIGCLFQDSSGKFFVGEHVHRFITDERTPNFGPWTSAKEFINAGIHRELKQLEDPEEWKEARKFSLVDGVVFGDVDMMKRFYKMLLELVDSVVEPPSTSGIIHLDWDGLNILVDKFDHTKVTGIIDWDFAVVRPAWMSYNWEFSIFRLFSSDGSRFEALHRIRNTVFSELAPEALSLQHDHYDIAYLVSVAWFRRLTGAREFMEVARVLAGMWPQGKPGSGAISDFLKSV